MKAPQWLKNIVAGIVIQFAREDAPAPEKKRTYSMSGWVRGSDGIYRSGDSVIFRRGKAWIRQDPPFGTDSPFDVETETSYSSLHAAIKSEIPGTFPLLESGESVTFPDAPLLGYAEPDEPGVLGIGVGAQGIEE